MSVEIGMLVETNQNAVGQLRYAGLLRSYTECIADDDRTARFAAGERGSVQRITARDEGKPYLVEVAFLDGTEDCLFADWLDVLD